MLILAAAGRRRLVIGRQIHTGQMGISGARVAVRTQTGVTFIHPADKAGS